MSTARVQIIAQPFPSTRRSTALAGSSVSTRTDVGFDDALFLLVAEGRRPSRSEMLLFSVGFAASLSLVFITSDLMNGKSVNPAFIAIFFLSAFYFVLIRRQRAAAANLAAEEERSAAEARQPRPNVIDKETRHRLLNYFILRPPEEEKKGDTNNGSNSNNSSSVVAVTGRRFGGSMFSLVPTPVSVKTHAPPPANESPLRSVGRVGGGNGDTGGAQESSGMASGGDQRPNDVENPERTITAATATAAAAAAAAVATTTGMADSAGDVAGGNEVGEGDRRCNISPRATSATGPDSGEAKGEWSTSGSCIVCFGDYVYGEELCRLPCLHVYHAKCIDEWLDGANHGWCPLCKTDVVSAATFLPTSDGSIDTNTNDNGNGNSNSEDGGGGGFSGRRWMTGTRGWRRHSTNSNSGDNVV